MGEKFFKVVFVYPDGHIEEIEDIFNSIESAKDFGENLTNQVINTERFHGGSAEGKRAPYFMVVEVLDGKLKMVFESQH